jgi:hypothetical protein
LLAKEFAQAPKMHRLKHRLREQARSHKVISAAGHSHGSKHSRPVTIVPMLRVGMPFVTFCVTNLQPGETVGLTNSGETAYAHFKVFGHWHRLQSHSHEAVAGRGFRWVENSMRA